LRESYQRKSDERERDKRDDALESLFLHSVSRAESYHVCYMLIANFSNHGSIPATPMPEGNQIWVLGVEVDSTSTIKWLPAADDSIRSESSIPKTTISKCISYVFGDCSTQVKNQPPLGVGSRDGARKIAKTHGNAIKPWTSRLTTPQLSLLRYRKTTETLGNAGQPASPFLGILVVNMPKQRKRDETLDRHAHYSPVSCTETLRNS